MAMTLYATNTTTATVGSNVQLQTTTTPGIYRLVVDVTNLASGEAVTITTNCCVKSGGTVNADDTQTYTGTGSAPTKHLISSDCVINTSGNWQLNQGNGTARNFDWAIWQFT